MSSKLLYYGKLQLFRLVLKKSRGRCFSVLNLQVMYYLIITIQEKRKKKNPNAISCINPGLERWSNS